MPAQYEPDSYRAVAHEAVDNYMNASFTLTKASMDMIVTNDPAGFIKAIQDVIGGSSTKALALKQRLIQLDEAEKWNKELNDEL